MVFLFTLPALKSFVIFTDFQINRASITNELCENVETDKNCKGTCHLVKEIKKETPEKKKSPFTAGDNTKIELLYFEKESISTFRLAPQNKTYISDQKVDFDAHLMAVFHPPQSAFFC